MKSVRKIFTDHKKKIYSKETARFLSLIFFAYFVNSLSDIKFSYLYICVVLLSLGSLISIIYVEMLFVHCDKEIELQVKKELKSRADRYIIDKCRGIFIPKITIHFAISLICFFIALILNIIIQANDQNVLPSFNLPGAEYIIGILIKFSQILLIATSISIIYSVTKFFHIAHAFTITVSSYFIILFNTQLDIQIGISIIFAIVCSTLLGVTPHVFLYKPLMKSRVNPMTLLISSIGLYIIMQNCISILWGDETKSIIESNIKVGHKFLDAYITTNQIITIIIALFLFVFIMFFLKYNKLGRDIRAVSSNPELSNIMGIDSNKITVYAYGIGSFIASIIGILIAIDICATPTMGFNLLLYGIIAMIISGGNTGWELIGGSLLLATAQYLSSYYIGSQWMDAIVYIILILFLLWKPLGINGNKLKKTEI